MRGRDASAKTNDCLMHAPNDPQTVRTFSSTKKLLSRRNFLNKVKTNVCLAPFRAQRQRFSVEATAAGHKIVIPRGEGQATSSCSGYAYAALEGQ